jgi:aminotransferase MxcL
MPLSAIAGPRRIMERMADLQVSTTFGGEIPSLAACIAACEVYQNSNYYAHVAQLGVRLREGVNHVAEQLGASLRVVGYDAIPMFLFSERIDEHTSNMKRFVGAMARRGILLRRDVNFLSLAHTDAQIDHLISATTETLEEMRGS